METLVRSRDDIILRSAVDETLDLLGQESKKILLRRLGMKNKEGNRLNAGENEGYLDYKKVIELIVQNFGSAATPLLHVLDEKIDEHRARIIRSS